MGKKETYCCSCGQPILDDSYYYPGRTMTVKKGHYHKECFPLAVHISHVERTLLRYDPLKNLVFLYGPGPSNPLHRLKS